MNAIRLLRLLAAALSGSATAVVATGEAGSAAPTLSLIVGVVATLAPLLLQFRGK